MPNCMAPWLHRCSTFHERAQGSVRQGRNMFDAIDVRSPPPTMGRKRMRTHNNQQALITSTNSAKSSQRKSSLGAASALLCVAALAVLSVSDQPVHLRSRNLQSDDSNSTGSATNSIHPYNYETVLSTQREYFSNTLMFLIFDPQTAEFKTYMKDSSKRYYEHVRSHWPTYLLSRALFQNFPDRFVQNAPPFQLLFTSYDLPPVERPCLRAGKSERCQSDTYAPIITFGSAPKDPTILPSLVQFPLTTFAGCLVKEHCFQLRDVDGEADQTELEWDDLIPQIVWRGSDFSTAPSMGYNKWLPGSVFRDEVDPARQSREEVVDGLMSVLDRMTPRWRAVTRSVMAQLDIEEERERTGGETEGKSNRLPFIDAKFVINRSNPLNKYEALHDAFLEKGIEISTEERMDESELKRYKYHLDLGGGGGTTWDGTIRKLMLPGVLFHHETPSKDWFYDELKPWVHYIPIDMTLENLHKKYLWAENNPKEAQKIARQGQEFVKKMRTKEWMDETYDKYFVRQLGEIVNAYHPSNEGEKESVDTILAEYERSSGGKHHLLTSVCNAKGCSFEDGFRLDGTTFREFESDERVFVV